MKRVILKYLICGTQEEPEEIVLSFGKDVRVVTVFKSPRPTYPALSMLSSSRPLVYKPLDELGVRHIHQFGGDHHQLHMLQLIQVKHRLLNNFGRRILRTLCNGGTTVDKRNPRSPDFKHKLTRKALWVDGWSTPLWAKAKLKLMIEDNLQIYHSRDSQSTPPSSRVPKGNNDKRSTLPAGESKQVVQGGSGGRQMQSARTTSEAIAILKNCLDQGIAIDSYMYVDVLKRCVKEKVLAETKQVHDCIVKSGMEQNTYVTNNLLRVYIRFGRLQDARQVFDELAQKDVYGWNIMIGGYAKQHHAKDAMDVLDQMRQQGAQPNEVTYTSILKACASPSALRWGEEIHAFIRQAGLESDVRVGTALVQMYAKCGGMKEARQAFEKVSNHNVISWTVMIGACAESGCGVEVYELFLQMQREGCAPNAVTFMSILNPSASARAVQWVKEVHDHAVKAGLDSDTRVGNALVHMYAKSVSLDDARQVFDRMKERDVITWTVMIGTYADSGCGVEAHPLFLQMVREGFTPDAITYMGILNACASAGALELVKEVHRSAQKAGLESNLRVVNVLIHSYAKCGSVDDARQVFERMRERDVISWNVRMGAYADSGCGVEAHALFLKMVQEGFTPDAITFMRLLNAYASAGVLKWVKEVDS